VENATSSSVVLLGHCVSLWWTGVDLFFVLSGFLIGGILIDHRNSTNYFKTFYVRRACRILPIYFLWIALFLLGTCLLSAYASSGWYSVDFRQLANFPQWGYFLFLQNFNMAKLNVCGASWIGVTWSLCVEEQFYLLTPLMIWLISPRHLARVLVVLIVSVPLFRIFLYLYHPDLLMYVLLPCRAEGLLLGILCAWLVRNQTCSDLIRLKRDWLYLLFFILFCGMVYLTFFSAKKGWFPSVNSLEMVSFGYTWISLFYALFLLMAVMVGTKLLAQTMRWQWLRHFGKISYCMYLIHLAIFGFVQDVFIRNNWLKLPVFLQAMATLLLSFGIVWLFAFLSWRLYEKPIIDRGHSFSYGDSKLLPQAARNPAGVISPQSHAD